MTKFDEYNLRVIAKAVSRLNPHAGTDIDEIINKMKSHASHLSRDNIYVAIGGFMLTAYWPQFDKDNMHVKASVADHCFSDDAHMPIEGLNK